MKYFIIELILCGRIFYYCNMCLCYICIVCKFSILGFFRFKYNIYISEGMNNYQVYNFGLVISMVIMIYNYII